MALDELRIKKAENGLIIMRKEPSNNPGAAEIISDIDIVKEIASTQKEAIEIIERRMGAM